MRVLMTADTVGGVWTYTRELVSGLVGRGHQVTLVSLGKLPSASQLSWMKGLSHIDFRPTEFRLEWMQEFERDFEESSEYLRTLISQLQPDVLHFNQYGYGALDYDLPRLVVAHSDVLGWWAAVHDAFPEQNTWLTGYRETVLQGISAADMVVAPSRWMMESLCSNYAQPARTQVIYNGRTPAWFDPDRAKSDCVLTVGRLWDQAKQAALLLEREHAIPVYIVGPDRHPEKVFAGAQGWPRGNKVHLQGEQSEHLLRALYAESSTYAATSRYEPFGLAPVEAALSRCALVANDIPVFRELWGDNAVYFRRNDADGLANVILELSRDEKLRSDYADRALEQARSRFDAARMIDEYEAVYAQLLHPEMQA